MRASRTTIRRCLAGILLIIVTAQPVAAQQQIGATSIVVNRVTGAYEGDTRTLKLGSQVRLNEVIETSKDGRTQIIFDDETTLSLAPLTKFTLDELVYDPATGDGALAITVTVGALRFISGAIATPQNYKINTPVGTIGIRGTIFDLVVAASGVTTVVLRAGSVIFTNLAGSSQTLTQPGTSTTVQTGSIAPTPPAPPPSSVIQAVTGISISTTLTTPAQIGIPTFDIGGGTLDTILDIPIGEVTEPTENGADAAEIPL